MKSFENKNKIKDIVYIFWVLVYLKSFKLNNGSIIMKRLYGFIKKV